MLLLAQDAEGDGGGMSDEQLRDEVMTLFLAGHETTANALTWTWYLLSQNPEAEARLHAELDAVLGGQTPVGRRPAAPEVHGDGAGRVACGSTRPPGSWAGAPRAATRWAIYTIPAGSIVLLSQYVMHHDERYYEDPFHFDPERWTARGEGRPPEAFATSRSAAARGSASASSSPGWRVY